MILPSRFNILTYGINEMARNLSHLKFSRKYIYHIFSYLGSYFNAFRMILTVTTDNNLYICYTINVYKGDALYFCEVLNEILYTS